MNSSARFCTAEESPSILAAILEECHDAVIRADLDGVIVGWSPGAVRLYGYSPEETIGYPLGILIPDDRGDEFVLMLEEIQAGTSVHDRETVRRTKDGRLVQVLLSMRPVFDERKRVVTALSMTRDVTALKQVEGDSRASDARWRAIFDSAVDGIIVIDAIGMIHAFNPAAERLFGYRAEEAIGRSVNVLMPPPYCDEHDQYLARYLAGGPPKIVGIGREVTARRRNGVNFPARLAVGEASVDGQTRFTGMVHDLTERVQMEKRLGEQAALAEVGKMSAVVAHEVRNALAGVRGAIQVIGSRLPEGSRDAAIAREVVTRLDVLTTMVKDMLLFAHLPEPKLEPIDVGQLVTLTASVVRNDPACRDVRIDVRGEAPAILGDATLLRTVLSNLLMNSAQAMDGVGTVRVSLEAGQDSCQILVSDEGPGMPQEVRDRLFAPFFTTKTRGSGLGLATAKRIVEAHGGDIRVEFPAEGGSRVVVQLPAQRPFDE